MTAEGPPDSSDLDDPLGIKPDGDDVRSWLAKWGQLINEYYMGALIAIVEEDRPAIIRRRDDRDLRLHGLLTFPGRPSQPVVNDLRRVLREQDELIDRLLVDERTAPTPAGAAPQVIPSSSLANYLRLLNNSIQRHVEALQRTYLWWPRWATVAAVGGLLAVVVGQAAWLARVGANRPLAVWGFLGLTVVGLGLVAAMLFTRAAASDLHPRWRLTLTALPALIVLVAALGSLLGGERPAAYVATAVVAALAALAVLTAAAVANNPRRTPDDALRLWLPLSTDRRLGTGRVDQLAAELQQAETVAKDCSRQKQRSAHSWGWTHILVGSAAAIASGAAGVTVSAADLTDGWRLFVALLALAGGGLTAVVTTLNPGRRGETAALTAASCEALAREIGVMRRLDLDYELKEKGGRAALEDVLIRYDAIVGVTNRDSYWSRLHGMRRGGGGVSGSEGSSANHPSGQERS